RAVHAELLPRLFCADRLADQGKHKRLGYAHDREFIIGVPSRIEIAAGAGQAYSEQGARHRRQCGVNIRVCTFNIFFEALMGFRYKSPDTLGRRQLACRYIGAFRFSRMQPRSHLFLLLADKKQGEAPSSVISGGVFCTQVPAKTCSLYRAEIAYYEQTTPC